MKNIFSRFAADQSGATAIEYGLIAGLISVVIITALTIARHQAQRTSSPLSRAT